MKDNHKADVSHTNEFDKMYQEMVKQAEDKYKVKSEYSDNEPLDVPTMTTDFIKEHGLPCPDGYIFKDENGDVINATKIVLEKKKKEYPKSYEECCKVLDWNHRDYDRVGYNSELLCKLQVLLLCRDAYWKIAGDEMGLGKPWEPDWTKDDVKHSLVNVGNTIIPSVECKVCRILAFPTKEMRDSFKENFDPDIELCKELL